jgi:serine/threonine protein kinase
MADRYVILERIAEGGMSTVYKVQDLRLEGRVAAMKEMSEAAIDPSEREEVLEFFQREAELLASLSHPNLVRVTDRFQENNRHYIVMEFVDGQTLETLLSKRQAPFPETQVLMWADQLCDALAYLHYQEPKIIYRDIKPANVMLLNDMKTVKLIDFGIARFYKPGKRKDTTEFGTDGYAPPEQYGKGQTDERSDVYALGAMLHQLLTLRDPSTKLFNFPPVRELNPEISERVDIAIAKAVAMKKNNRYTTIGEMRVALMGDTGSISYVGVLAGHRERHTVPTGHSLKGDLSSGISFGSIQVGYPSYAQSLTIGEPARLRADVPWLAISPTSIQDPDQRVSIRLLSHQLGTNKHETRGETVLHRWAGLHTRLFVPEPKEHSGTIEIDLQKTGRTRRVPVTVTAEPSQLNTWIGWGLTIAAMALEVMLGLSIPVAILLAVLLSL